MRILLSLPLLLASTAAFGQPMAAADLHWGPAPPGLPKGAEMAVLAGDPTKPGMFVVRLRMPAGYRVPAHHHPTDELVTLLSGECGFGMGDKLDPAKGTMVRAGDFVRAVAGMNHFVWATSPSVVQISAQGPFAITYVNPADDPRR